MTVPITVLDDARVMCYARENKFKTDCLIVKEWEDEYLNFLALNPS